MSAIDKYEPKGGGFRAVLAANYATAELALGVGLNGSGRATVGASGTGVKGVICMGRTMLAGEVIDVMTDGEIVEVPSIGAGQNVYADNTTGALSTTSAGGTYVGHTVEAGRLVVRVAR